MRKYSDFFKTLHDEQSPTGYLGSGTHYSVLRAAVFHGATGQPLPNGRFADFAIIWDEDHDDRVIEPIEKIYLRGLLPFFSMFGERKGSFTAILANNIHDQSGISSLQESLNRITGQLDTGDSWPACVTNLESPDNSIIDASAKKVSLYLKNLKMLWELGVAPTIEEMPVNPALLTEVDDLSLSIRTASCLQNAGIVYVDDLVQKTEAELLRLPNFGRKPLNEIKEVLTQMGLHLGMTDSSSWRSKNSERLVRRLAIMSVS